MQGNRSVSYTHLDVYKRQGYRGYTIFAENFGGLLITSNNIFPRGKSIVHLKGCLLYTSKKIVNSLITATVIGSMLTGMAVPCFAGEKKDDGSSITCLLYTSRCV